MYTPGGKHIAANFKGRGKPILLTYRKGGGGANQS